MLLKMIKIQTKNKADNIADIQDLKQLILIVLLLELNFQQILML